MTLHEITIFNQGAALAAPTVQAVQGDSGRVLRMYIPDCNVGEVKSARLYVLKPSGAEVYANGSVKDGSVEVTLTTQILAEVGRSRCQLETTCSTGKTTSFEFLLDVAPSLVSDSAIESSNEYTALEVLLQEAEQKLEDLADVRERMDALQENAFQSATARGSIVTANTAKAPFSSLKIIGHTEKSDNTLTTAGSDGSVRLTKCGKNLFNPKYADGIKKGGSLWIRIKNGNENVHVSITDKDTSVAVPSCYFGVAKDIADIEKGYTWLYRPNGLLHSNLTTTYNWFVLSDPTEEKFNSILARYNIQVEVGETATDYEPYNGTTINFSTPNGLASVGDVCDTLTVRADGTGELTKRLATVVFDGTEAWGLTTTNNGNAFWRQSSSVPGALRKVHTKVCSHLPYTSTSYDRVKGETMCENSFSGTPMFIFHTTKATTVSEWQALLESDPITVVYQLGTPTVTELSVEEVSAFLALTSNKGITNVFTDDIAEVECTYAVNSESANYLGEIIAGLKAQINELTTALVDLSATD